MPGSAERVALLPAHEQARRIRRGELSAAGLLEACMGQLERHNGTLNAVVTVDPRAPEAARSIDRRLAAGQDPGPLAGLVVGIKDVTETAGLRTTYGSALFADHVPEEDALVVRRFRAAGAVILGKTNTPEFAAGGTTWNDVFGITRNPWDPTRTAGGSTGGGAAALAAGMISLAQGTDLGGSLRIPASFCGVVGLRPTAGLIPTLPSPYLWDDLQVTGTMGRAAADVALSLRALSGPAAESPIAAPPWSPGAREDPGGGDPADGAPDGGSADGGDIPAGLPDRPFAYCPDVAGFGIDPEVEAVCRAAIDRLRSAGAEVREIALDLGWARDAFRALRGHWFVAQLYDGLDRIDRYGVNVAANLRAGLEVSARELGAAENARRRVRERFVKLFETFAALLTPCMAVPPFAAEENYPRQIAGRPMRTYIDWVAPTFLLSLPGLPVASVPAGLDSTGLPVGLQVVAPPFDEALALRLAGAVQARCPLGPPPCLEAAGP